MPQTGTEKSKIKCSKCSKTFDSIEELRQHEASCAADSAKPEKPAIPSEEEIETDMKVEDRFEATDH